MRLVPRAVLTLVVVLAAPVARAPVAAQAPWVLEWLQAYADGHQADIVEKLRSVSNLKMLADDLDKLAPKWLAAPADVAERHRRAIIAFALDAAFARLDQGKDAGKLAEWSCRQIRRHATPDEFDHAAHLAIFAILGGAVDPDALETHVVHVRFQFPSEPRLALERGIAEELRGAPFYQPTKQVAADVTRHREEAARRYTEAAKIEAIRGEASLRLGHVDLDLGRNDEALTALNGAEPALKDPALVYLARLFRGMALERLGRIEDARQAYTQALTERPRTQSASLVLAALEFRRGDRATADQMVRELLSRTAAPADPWWDYWPGDYRLGNDLLRATREAVK